MILFYSLCVYFRSCANEYSYTYSISDAAPTDTLRVSDAAPTDTL